MANEPIGGNITEDLLSWREGDKGALARLSNAIYSELRRIAGRLLINGSGNQTIQPTELVHELYFHLPGIQQVPLRCRTELMSIAARMMRNILVDHARRRHSAKRGGGSVHITGLDSLRAAGFDASVSDVHDALERLTADYPRHARVVELRFFGGLTTDETVSVLRTEGFEASTRTVQRDWTFAKAWLQNAIRPV